MARPEAAQGVDINHALRKASERATEPLTVAMIGREGVLLHRVQQLLGVTSPRRTGSTWLAGLLTLSLVLSIALSSFVSSRAEVEKPNIDSSAGRESPDATDVVPKSDDDRSDGKDAKGDEPSNSAAGSEQTQPIVDEVDLQKRFIEQLREALQKEQGGIGHLAKMPAVKSHFAINAHCTEHSCFHVPTFWKSLAQLFDETLL